MAEEKNDLEYQDEAYHNVEKSRFQSFMDIFRRPKALPESSQTKHKTTNMSIEATMSLREFRKNLVEKVGNFFQTLSRIGSPKKDENLNKFAKEVVGNPNTEKASEKTRIDEETVVSQQPRYFPGDVSIKTVHEPINTGTIILAESTAEQTLDNEIEGNLPEMDSSIDTGVIDIDNKVKDINTPGIEASTINVSHKPEMMHNTNPKQKNVIIPGTVGKTARSVEEKDGPDL